MPKRNGAAALNLTEEETKTKRVEALAQKKKRALEQLAEAEQMSRELGVSAEPEVGEEDTNGESSPALERLTAAVSEIDQNNGYWEAHRTINGVRSKLGRFDIASWPDHLEQLARDIGGGVVTVTIRDVGGRYITSGTFNYDPATYKKSPDPVAVQPQNDMAKFIELMDRRDAQHKAELAEMRRETMDLQKTLISSLVAQDPLKSVTGIKTLLELVRPEKSRPIDAVRDVVDMFKLMRGESIEPPSLLESLLSKAVDVLGPVLQASVVKKPADSAPSDKESLAAKPSAPTESRPALAAPEVQSVGEMKMLGDQLLLFIQKGASPETAASAIADLLTKENALQFKPLTDDVDIADKLMKTNSGLMQSRVWLVDFCRIMKEYIEDVLAPEELVENAPTGN